MAASSEGVTSSDMVGRMARLPWRILSEIEISSSLALWSNGTIVDGSVAVSGSESEVAGEDGFGEGSAAGVFVGVAATENWGRLEVGAAWAGIAGRSVSESEEWVVWWGVGAGARCSGFFVRGFDTRGPKATVFFRRTFPLRRVMVCSDEEMTSS